MKATLLLLLVAMPLFAQDDPIGKNLIPPELVMTQAEPARRPAESRGRQAPDGMRACQSLFATLVKVFFRFVPSVPIMVMQATEMSAAIRPYSMAVAPDSSFTKRLKRVIRGAPFARSVHLAPPARGRPAERRNSGGWGLKRS